MEESGKGGNAQNIDREQDNSGQTAKAVYTRQLERFARCWKQQLKQNWQGFGGNISRMTSRFVLGPGFKIARRDVKFNPLYGVRLNSKRVTITSLFPWKQRTRTDFETRNSDTLRVSSHLQRTGSRSKSK